MAPFPKTGSLPSLVPITPGVASRARHHLCSAGCAAQRQDANRPGMEFYGGATTESQHGAARGLCRLVRIPRLRECRSQHHSRADLFQRRAAVPRAAMPRQPAWPAFPTSCRKARSIFPGPAPRVPNPNLGAGFFWYTEGNSSYNALQVDVIPPLQQRPAVPRELHLVEGSGYEFRAHRRAGQQSSADDSGPQRSAPRLGTVGVQHSQSGQHFGYL